MPNPRHFRNFQQFKKDLVGHHGGPLSSSIEDMADDLFHTQINEEFDSLWDDADSEDD